jgi:hypothetical protein
MCRPGRGAIGGRWGEGRRPYANARKSGGSLTCGPSDLSAGLDGNAQGQAGGIAKGLAQVLGMLHPRSGSNRMFTGHGRAERLINHNPQSHRSVNIMPGMCRPWPLHLALIQRASRTCSRASCIECLRSGWNAAFQ